MEKRAYARSAVMLLSAAAGALLFAACPTRPNPLFCSKDVHCADPTMICDVAQAQCYPASADLSVPGDAGSMPDLAKTACNQSSECGVSAPVCANHQCGPCTAGDGGLSSDCATRTGTLFCSPAGACVACLTNADCAATNQTCNSNNQCVACATNADCASGICVPGAPNACARSSDVFLVDNRGMTPATCRAANPNADGNSPATALCDIQDAINQVVARPYIVVAASTQSYGSVSVTGSKTLTVDIVSATRLGATILGDNQGNTPNPAISVTGGADALDVTFDGFSVKAPMINASSDIVDCTGSANPTSLTIRNSSISNSAQVGVNGSLKCSVTLDSDAVSKNDGGGLNFASKATYSVTNCFIFSNDTGPGVTFDPTVTGVFAFNTVVGNGGTGMLNGGVSCGSTQKLESSIVALNSKLVGSQLSVGCQLLDVLTGPDMATGANMAVPIFIQCDPPLGTGIGYCLGNGSPGVDLVTAGGDAGARTLTDHDYFGAPRPHGAGYDVGAEELQK